MLLLGFLYLGCALEWASRCPQSLPPHCSWAYYELLKREFSKDPLDLAVFLKREIALLTSLSSSENLRPELFGSEVPPLGKITQHTHPTGLV